MEYFLVPILLFFVFAVWGFATKPHLAIACILLATLINTWFIDKPLELGISILPHDVVFVPLLFSTIYRLIFKKEFHSVSILWCLYGLLLFFWVTVGMKQYGTVAAADFRSCFYYWMGTLYFMTFQYSQETIQRFVKYWLGISLILLAIVYFRFVADIANLPIALEWRAADTTGVRLRVISSGDAYLLSVAIAMLFHRYIQPSLAKPSKIIAALFIVAVIVLQHRSVWIATLVAIMSTMLMPGIKNTKIFGNLTVIVVVGFILLLPVIYFGYADKIIGSVADSAEKATSLTTGTFGGRVKNWQHIIDYWQHQSFENQLLGDKFGSGYAGNKTTPHNFYFQALLRVGALGALLLLIIYLSTMLKLYFSMANNRQNNLYASLFLMLLIGQQMYYIPYAHRAEHGIILGIAISIAKRKSYVLKDGEQKAFVLGKPYHMPVNMASQNA